MAMTLRRTLFVGVLACALPGARVSAQAAVPSSARSVLVTPLLHSSALSDSLARLVRQELAVRYRLTLVADGDVTSALQRTDSAGKGWTFESVRNLANAFKADALVDVAAVRVADGMQVTVAWGKAPFSVIANTSRLARTSLDVVAQAVAQEITRGGWPVNAH